MKKNKSSSLVYSTEGGRVNTNNNASAGKRRPKQKALSLPDDGIVRLMSEKKGRKGKGVTLICGLPQEPAALKRLAKTLKQKCGSGGSVKNGIIEIQGDHRDFLKKELCSLGHQVKLAGG